ncbi:MAG TPA: serine--tRNA ligase [Patescibacteria group bacterium]|jgi:seryl-tRNA synthetase|nr:serine--tRNA ligase [Patescibacteria group bacterium]
MLDIKFVRENQDAVKKAIADKQMDFDLDVLIKMDDVRRSLIIDSEALRSRRNELNEKLKKEQTPELVEESKKLKEELDDVEEELVETEKEWTRLMLMLPNIPLAEVPVGKDESANKILKKWGEAPKFKFPVKDHTVLGFDLNIIDIDRAGKVSGSRFGYWKGGAAMLELALIQFVYKTLTNEETVKKIADTVETGYNPKPFVPVIPPVMIKSDVYTRTGRLSDADKDDKYYLQQDDLYLIGSAEHTLVPIHMDETLPEAQLPIRYLGFSTSFRREAGSYGKDVKGMLRVHQFDKIEMESFSLAENSLKEHNFLIAVQEYLMQALEIPYQLVMNSTGDMGKPNARQVDVESWLPGQDKYRETHSADYMTDFQARRLGIKVKRASGALEFLHTNDATALAMPRILIAIMENNQQEDGSIKVPKVLVEFTGFDTIKKS